MLRVGLTGGLGSGKSTVSAIFAELGAYVAQADAIGRELMQPGQVVFQQIVDYFGPSVLTPEGTLNRTRLAEISFTEGRVEELNRIVHPATIQAQDAWMQGIAERDPNAVCIVESALIFETKFADYRTRFDRLILVLAPEALRIQRFIARQPGASEADARRRMAAQMSDFEKLQRVHFVIRNDSTLNDLRRSVELVWHELQAAAMQK